MTSKSIRPADGIRRHCWPILLLLLAAGCSSKGTVVGKVTYKGKPLSAGMVLFVPEQGGGAFRGDIQDGEYHVEKIPPGPVKIAITPASTSSPMEYVMKMRPPADVLEKAAPGTSVEQFTQPAPPPQAASIPEKFLNPDTSGLTYTVQSGSQRHDIELPAK